MVTLIATGNHEKTQLEKKKKGYARKGRAKRTTTNELYSPLGWEVIQFPTDRKGGVIADRTDLGAKLPMFESASDTYWSPYLAQVTSLSPSL